jgi:hypothetical protein
MLNFNYKLYFSCSKRTFFGQKDFLGRLWAFIFRITAPFYYASTAPFCTYGLSTKRTNETTIVSITTFPTRIDKVALTIESILRQKEKPDKILLWLYEGEFKGENSLPENLLRLMKRGLEIRFCKENLMPHKKYYYTMLEYPNANVITIDDDMFYPSDLILKLKLFHKKHPTSILCCVARKIQLNEGKIDQYSKWSYENINSEPIMSLLPIGAGGVFYPQKSLHKDIFDLETLKKYALKADDLWLKIMSLRNNTKVVSLAGEYSRLPINVVHGNDIKLMDSNIGEAQNDSVLRELMNHYQICASIFKHRKK